VAWSSSQEPGAVIALLYSILPAIAVVYGATKGVKPSRNSAIGVIVATIAVGFLIGTGLHKWNHRRLDAKYEAQLLTS
jgi:hypothetical protein